MFSIKYLYQIKNNFAILYSGEDQNIIEKLYSIKNEYSDLNIFLFIKNIKFNNNNIYKYEKFVSLNHMFAKYYEIKPDNSNYEDIFK